MAALEPILVALRARGDELKSLGPGRVDVARINHINEVRMLRECRELLTPAEQLEIRHAMIELESHLHGIVLTAAPPADGFFDRFKRALRGGTPDETGPMAMPPPQSLIDAAEAWVIAELTRGQVDIDVEVLTAPWLGATVSTED